MRSPARLCLAPAPDRPDIVGVTTRVAPDLGPRTDVSSVLSRVRLFFAERIWAVRLADLRRGQALAYRASRVAYTAVLGFFANRLTVRAAALTYYSVLSIVPFLAFAFAVLKGFGAYRSFVDGVLRPYLQDTFGANPALLGSMQRVLQFVDRTDVSKLGAVGLLVLIYTSIALLSSVEDTLNQIWGARSRRSFLRQVTDYVTLLVIAPLLVTAAAAAITAAQSSTVVLFLRDRLALGGMIDFLLQLAPFAIVAIAFFATYVSLPNVRIRPASAALGAAVAAVLWQGALVLYVRFQAGVSSYNALYSVLSAVPIFLVWTYISWVVVLAGAQVAASHQNERESRQRYRALRADPEELEKKEANSRSRLHCVERRMKDNVTARELEHIKGTLSSYPVCCAKKDKYGSFTFASTIMVLGEKPVLHIAPGPPNVTPFESLSFTPAK